MRGLMEIDRFGKVAIMKRTHDNGNTKSWAVVIGDWNDDDVFEVTITCGSLLEAVNKFNTITDLMVN